MTPYDPDSDPTYHVPGTTAPPVPSVRSVTPRPAANDSDDDNIHNPFEDTPSYGYTANRPPPITVQKGDKHVAYAPVNPSDIHNDTYTDPYTPYNHSDDHIPLFNIRSRSTAEARSKRYSTALPSTPLPHSPVPPGLAGGTGWLDRFEPAPVLPLIIHATLCVVSFPIIFFVTPAANGLPMFWTRLIVGAIYGVVGLSLGVSLLDLSRRGIEAALWATIIHESMDGSGGVTLSQLDYHTANPDSPWAAILLLYRRLFKHTGTHRSRRKNYDGVPWSFCIVLFLLTSTVAACLVFVFGRVVDIYTRQVTQTNIFKEVAIIGDLSPDDVARATNVSDTFRNYAYTWSLTPFASSAHLPKDRSFWITRPTSNKTDAVHFAEVYTSQLKPNGSGFGSYFANMTAIWANATTSGKVETTEAIGETIRWPRWGQRMVCQTISETNGGIMLVPRSAQLGLTYMYVTRSALQNLLAFAEISSPDLSVLPPVDLANLTAGDSATPAEIAQQDIALTGKWWDNGVAHQFQSYSFDRGDSGLGWSMIELILVRLNESYAPEGQFHAYAMGDQAARTRIGYDGAICVQEIRSYFLDAYNNTAGLPTTLGFLYDGVNFNTTGKKQDGPTLEGVQRGVNSTGKWVAFSNAHFNSRNVMIKDNGRDTPYVPNPTLVSFTGEINPNKYTVIRSSDLQDVLGDVDSQHLLPYLVGTQPIVGHTYPDKTVAYVKVYLVWLIVSLVVTLILGFVVAIFVPRLPLGLPRRDFGVFSWLAAIEGDSLVNLPMGVGRLERLEELQRKAKDVRVRYAAPDDQ